MKKLVISLALCLVGFGLFFYLGRYGENTPHELQENLVIGYSRLRISLPVFVAQEQGIFKKHGLDVKLEMYDTAQPLMQALLEGNINVGGYTALPITFNGILRSGVPLYFITTLVEDESHRLSYLLVGSKSGIESVSDLRGKT